MTGRLLARLAARPLRCGLFHCHRPRNRMLLRERLAEWVVEMATRFDGTKEFVQRPVGVLAGSHLTRVRRRPGRGRSGSRGHLPGRAGRSGDGDVLVLRVVEIRREDDDGQVRVVDESDRASSSERKGMRSGAPRNAHVVAIEDVTSLTFSAPASTRGRPHEAGATASRKPPSGTTSMPGSTRAWTSRPSSTSGCERAPRTARSTPLTLTCSRRASCARCSAWSTSSRCCLSRSCAPRCSETPRVPRPRRRTAPWRSSAPCGREGSLLTW